MPITVELNKTFIKLNSNDLRNKTDFRTRERRAIVDVNVTQPQLYITGGLVVDFSKIRNFVEIYSVTTINQPLLAFLNFKYEFIHSPDLDPSKVKMGIVTYVNSQELFAGSTVNPGGTIMTEIIGI